MIGTYNGYQNGVLPHAGGLSSQPAMFSSIMSIIDSALEQERELEQEKDDSQRQTVDAHRQAAEGGPVSLLHGPKPSGSAKIPVPGK